MGTARHYPLHQVFDSSGNPLTGGTIQGFIAGTTTPKYLYTNRTDALANTDGSYSLSLPTDGSCILWLVDDTRLKLVIQDSTGAVIPNGTIDYISGEFDQTSATLTTAAETITTGPLLMQAGLIEAAQGATLASATTTDLSTATGNSITVSGTTTITALGTVPAGTQINLTFSGILTLTYNASSLILPGAANIVTAAGDACTMLSLGSGNWKCINYTSITGVQALQRTPFSITSATTTDLSTATSTNVSVTGTTTITALGTVVAGVQYTLTFTGILTLTYNGTSLLLPGKANITTAAGDYASFTSLGSGNWVCTDYMPVSGQSLLARTGTLASATTTDLSTVSAQYITVTGSTTITSFGTSPSGTIKYLSFSGSPQITFNVTSMILLYGVTWTAVFASTVMTVVSLGSGNWQEISRVNPSATTSDSFPLVASATNSANTVRLAMTGTTGTNVWSIPNTNIGCFVVQRVSTETGAVATGTTAATACDTIPPNTAGDQYMTLAITPKNTANILVIDIVIMLSNSNASMHLIAALFQDSTTNALAAMDTFQATAGTNTSIKFRHIMAAGTTSSTTFKVRAGANTGATTTFNGEAGGRYYGGVAASSIMITEYSS